MAEERKEEKVVELKQEEKNQNVIEITDEEKDDIEEIDKQISLTNNKLANSLYLYEIEKIKLIQSKQSLSDNFEKEVTRVCKRHKCKGRRIIDIDYVGKKIILQPLPKPLPKKE